MDGQTYNAIAKLAQKVQQLEREVAHLKSQLETRFTAGGGDTQISVMTDSGEWTERLIGEGWEVRNVGPMEE